MKSQTAVILILLLVALFLVGLTITSNHPITAFLSAVNPNGSIRFTTGPFCGNGRIDPGEQCEPPGVGLCSENCTLIGGFCGDGIIVPPEECEPPNTATCNANCRLKTPPGGGGGGGGGKPHIRVPPIVRVYIEEQPAPVRIPCLVHEFTIPAALDQMLSQTRLRVKVPDWEDIPHNTVPEENPNFLVRLSASDEYYQEIWPSTEPVINIVSNAEPLQEYQDKWALRSVSRKWKLNVSEYVDFPILAENLMFGYRPINIARFSAGNYVPINITTNGTGMLSGINITVEDIVALPVAAPEYFVKVTEVVDGYIGVYFVLDGYNFRTVDNEYIIDFEINLDKELFVGDILPSIKLVPGEYNIIYKRYKVPDVPAQGMYDITSRIYEKGRILPHVAKTIRGQVDFRKQAPTAFGKIIVN